MMIQGYSSIQFFRAQGRLLIENERSTADSRHRQLPRSSTKIPSRTTRRSTRFSRAATSRNASSPSSTLGDVPEFNGTMTPPATPVSLMLDLRQRFLALLWRQEAAPAARGAEGDAHAGRIGAGQRLHRTRQRRPGARQPPGGRLVRLDRSEVRREGRQHADRGVRRPEPAGQAADQREHARLAREGAGQPAEQGRGERAGARRVPRQAERPVARRQAEHRAVAAQPAERRGDQGEDGAGAEGDAVQPGQDAPAVRRAGRRPGRLDSRSSPRTRRSRASRASCIDLQHQKVQLSERYGEKHPGAPERDRAAAGHAASAQPRSRPRRCSP